MASNAPLVEPRGGTRVQLIWNKGIASLCDHRLPDEFPDGCTYSRVPTFAGALSSRRLPENLISDPQRYARIQDGDLVWIRVAWLKSFAKKVLPLVNARFVLVTGDSDSCIPSELPHEVRALLDSPKITRWYAQNYDGSDRSGKLLPIPIGIDFHMLSEKPIWGESQSSPEQQEAQLKALLQQLPSIEHRIPAVYVDFPWRQGFGLFNYRRFHPLVGTKFRELRRKVAQALRHNVCVVFQNDPLPRSQMWRIRGQYAFVLSPHGIGLDCHRTWEALALGHIVLVPSSSLDPMYEGLPLVPLHAWNEISPANLQQWLEKFRGFSGLSDGLLSRYWISKMRSVGSRPAMQ